MAYWVKSNESTRDGYYRDNGECFTVPIIQYEGPFRWIDDVMDYISESGLKHAEILDFNG